MTYNGSEHDVTFDDHGVMVLGSGVYRQAYFNLSIKTVADLSTELEAPWNSTGVP